MRNIQGIFAAKLDGMRLVKAGWIKQTLDKRKNGKNIK